MLVAHIDSVPPAPGADDNASGVGTLVALAPRLRAIGPTCDVWLIATGAEERPYTGAADHLGALAAVPRVKRRASDLRFVLSLDEVGRGRTFHLRSPAARQRPAVEGAVIRAGRGASAGCATAGTGNSDHREFALAGLPAAKLGVPDDPCRHTACDRPARLQARAFPLVRGDRGAAAEPEVELGGGQRAAEVVALGAAAAQVDQRLQDALGLHALGDDVEAEVAGEVDRRADDHGVAVVVGHRGDEGAVDLDLVERQLLEVGERRLAGAEVVEREPDAERAQRREHLGHALRIAHHGGLGDLALERAAGQAVLVEQLGHHRRQADVEHVGGRQVDRDGQVRVLEPPLGALAQRGVEHPAREVGDRAGALGERDELVGLQQPVLGVLPAHERLDARHAVALERDLRLVVQDELVALDRAPQLAQEAEPGRRVGIALGRVGLDAALGALGVVHRDVGALDQRRDVAPVLGREGDADARVELDGDPVQAERPAQRVVEARRRSRPRRRGAGGR